MQAVFILPDYWKDWAFKKANDSWRNFKKDLRRHHLKDSKTGVIQTSVPSIYDSYITQEQWTEFVRISLSPEFKVLLSISSSSLKINKYYFIFSNACCVLTN